MRSTSVSNSSGSRVDDGVAGSESMVTASGNIVQLRYWGDDPNSDDLLYGPIAAPNVFAAADGLHYQHNVALTHSVLDEDNTLGVMDDSWGVATEEDEIYVGARFLDPSGKTVSVVESNRIEGNF